MRHSPSGSRELRCTAFEELMLDQDRPETPCVICLRCDLSGQLDLARLRESLTKTVALHPMLRARLKWHWGKLWWHFSDGSMPTVVVHDQPAPAWPKQRFFDLTSQIGLQVDLYQHARSSESTNTDRQAWTLFVQIHHAAADGLGCLQFVQDWLAVYDQSALAASTANIAAHVLAHRNQFGLDLWSLCQLIPKQIIGLAGVKQYLSRQPVPLSSTTNEQSRSDSISAIHYRCSLDETATLKQLAKSSQATLNDLLACFVFEACHDFRRQQANHQPNEWLRMMVPMSLRESDKVTMSACNVVGCVFLDRTGPQITDRSQLLESIHAEMELIKRNRLVFLFIFSLWLRKIFRFRRTSAGVIVAPVRRCQTSVVFSNMGRLFEKTALTSLSDGRLRAGQLVLEACEVLAPVTTLMNVAITAFQYAGRLTLSLHYDARYIQPADAQYLLARIVDRVSCTTSEAVSV